MKHLLMVFLGGGIGSILRFLISKYTLNFWNKGFPLGTFLVNMMGCFLIGLFIAYFTRNQTNQSLQFLLIAGFCGGFTTFSTFSLESVQLYQQQHFSTLILYIGLSIIIGLFLTFTGIKLAK